MFATTGALAPQRSADRPAQRREFKERSCLRSLCNHKQICTALTYSHQSLLHANLSSRQSVATRDLFLHRPTRVKPKPPIATNGYRWFKSSIFNPETAFSCRYRQVLTEKSHDFIVFLADTGKLSFIVYKCYSSPKYSSLPLSILNSKLFGQGCLVEYEKSLISQFFIGYEERTISLNFIYLFEVVKQYLSWLQNGIIKAYCS